MKNRLPGAFARTMLLASPTWFMVATANAQSGVWIGEFSGDLWSETSNWAGGTVANGTGNTADFSTVDLPFGEFMVTLDSPRTIGNIIFGDTDPDSTPGTWSLTGGNVLTLDGATPTINADVNATIATVIAGTAGFTKSGPGELLLTANNSATLNGPVLLADGVLRLGGGQPNAQQALGAPTNPITFEGGSLSLNGSTGPDNTSGFGTLSNPLFVGPGQTGGIFHSYRANIASTLTGSGTLNVHTPFVRGDFSGNWSAFTGNINLTGSHFRITNFQSEIFDNAKLHIGGGVHVSQHFNPPNNAIGNTQDIGELSGAPGAILSGHGVASRFVNWQIGALNTDSEFAGTLQDGRTDSTAQGQMRLYKVGTGTLSLTGANTHTGGTEVNAGTLQIGNGGASGSLGNTNVTVAAGANLVFNRDDSATSAYPGILAGGGNVIKRGTGTVNFTGANTYTAGTLIEGGRIGINSNLSLGLESAPVTFAVSNGGIFATAPGIVSSRAFDIASGVTATFGSATAADSYTLGGIVSGAGSLAVDGAGIVRLSAANTYGGGTTVNSGTLAVANTTGSATSTGTVTVNGGALAGAGTIAGAVTVGAAGDIKPGAITTTSSSVGDLTVGSLALAGGTEIFVELKSGSNDRIVVTSPGGLTSTANAGNPVLVDLRQENSTAKWITPGTYPIIQFSGAFAGTPNSLFQVNAASQQAGLTYQFQISGNTLQLVIGGADPSIWNVDGPGNWTNAGNWLNGVPNGTGAVAQLSEIITAPRTITLDANQTVGFLQFNNANSYTVAGTATLTFDQSSGNAQIGVLLGNHTVSANLQLADSIDIVIQNPESTLSLLGTVSGPGGSMKSSVGNLVLGGNNSFAGEVDFSNGVLTFATGGLGTGGLVLDNATLAWQGGNTQDITNRTITFGDNPVTFAMDGNVTFANDFGATGLAPFIKDGSGNLTLAQDTFFQGNVTVTNGTLTLGNGGTTGSVLGSIDLAGMDSQLVINRSDDMSLDNLVTGAGSVIFNGANEIALSASNTFSGTTTINAGSVVLINPLGLQNSTLLYNSGGGDLNFGSNFQAALGALDGDKDLALSDEFESPVTLTVGGNDASTFYSGVLSGSGGLRKIGAGIMTVDSLNTFTGNLVVAGGAIEMINGAAVTPDSLTIGGAVDANDTPGPRRLSLFDGTIQTTGLSFVTSANNASAAFEMDAGSADFPSGLNALGNFVSGYLIRVGGGTLSAGAMSIGRGGLIYNTEPTAGSDANGLYINGGDVAISGPLNMGIVGAANSSVSTRIDSGSLEIGGPVTVGLNNGGRWSILDVNGGDFTSTDTTSGIVLGGPLVGNAVFLSRFGVATVERFQFGQGALGGSSTVHVTDFGELYVGSGGMVVGTTQPGFVSTLRLTGGILGAKDDWSTDIPATTANIFGIKAADGSDTPRNITLNGPVSGSGTLHKLGGGTLTLNAPHSYTGDTWLDAGTLVLKSATLSDSGTVDVSGTATLNLDFSGTDTVAGFSIDGVPQAEGTWGGIGSSAEFTTLRITGDGLLHISPDPFTPWISQFGSLAGADAEKSADPDNDGLTNAEEFAFDGNPESGASSGKFRAGVATVGGEQALVITLPVRNGAVFAGDPGKSAEVDGLTYTISGSNDLSLMDQVVTEITADSAGLPAVSPGWSYRTFRLDGAIGSRGPRGFLKAAAE